jgi:glucosylceramidase
VLKVIRSSIWGTVVVLALAGASMARARPAHPFDAKVIQTTIDLAQRMASLPDIKFHKPAPASGVPVITVNEAARYQRVSGIGAAMTDSSAWLIEKRLVPSERSTLLTNLFGAYPAGIHISFLRVPMGASDFTQRGKSYSYDDLPPGQTDPALKHFSIAHDLRYIIPALRAALAIDPQMELLANPWSPPGWMKTNDALNNYHNSGLLYGWAYRPFANYFVKFLEAYAAQGVPIRAITPNNEPGNPTRYPGLQLGERAEAHFIQYFLAPALRAAGLHTQIFGGDSGLSPGSVGFAHALAASTAAPLLSGMAWHCYHGSPIAMSQLRALYPNIGPMMDECAQGLTSSISETIIAALNNWASAVVLFNLALDTHRGPVEPHNGCPGCTAEATVDQRTATFTLGLNYYQLGQASGFIMPGAHVIAGNHFVSYNIAGNDPSISTPGLDDVALQNPDGSIVLLAYDNATTPVTFAVSWHGQSFTYTLQPRATVTFDWNRP